MTIVATDFRLEEHSDHVMAFCKLRGEGFPPRLWFRVPLDNAEAIDMDEPNWAAMSLYWQAMTMGEDLVVEAELSPLLLHNMNGDLLALMQNYDSNLKEIRVETGMSSGQAPAKPRDVMTGFSGGVDSFATFLLYSKPELPPSLRLTSFGVYHVGAMGATSDPELLAPAFKHAETQAKAHGLKMYSVWGNMDEVYAPAERYGAINFRKTVGFRNAAATLLLQNGVQTFLPSGAVSYRKATYGPYTCTQNLDPVLQPMLATEKLRVLPAGAGLSRTDKIALLADDPEAQQRLHVCAKNAYKPGPEDKINCSQCYKCVETQMILDTIGKLDKFDAVFDLSHYKYRRTELLRDIAVYSRTSHNESLKGQIDYARKMGIPIPRTFKEVVKDSLRPAYNRLRRML